MARPRKFTPKTVNIALSESQHRQLLDFADLFNLSVGTTSEIIFRNGMKNIIAVQIGRLQKKIDILKEFDE